LAIWLDKGVVAKRHKALRSKLKLFVSISANDAKKQTHGSNAVTDIVNIDRQTK